VPRGASRFHPDATERRLESQRVSTRIASTSLTRLAPDGSVEIELMNSPEEGEDYSPTRTVLSGQRVSAAGVASGPRSTPQ